MNWLQHLWLHWQSRRYFRRLQRDDARLMSNADVRYYAEHALIPECQRACRIEARRRGLR